MLFSVKLGEHNQALDTFEKASEMASLQGDKAAQGAIKKAMDDVKSKIVKNAKDQDDASGKNALHLNNRVFCALYLHLSHVILDLSSINFFKFEIDS